MTFREEYWKPIQKDLEAYFYQVFWKDILEALEDPYYRLNAKSYLLDAIRKGTIQYKAGTFTGVFNMHISAELERFAKYDAKRKVWTGVPPASISAAAAIANDKARALNDRISRLISDIPGKVADTIEQLKYRIDRPLEAMNTEASAELRNLGIDLDVTPELSQRFKDNYKTNQDLNIKSWEPNQVERMREMVEKNVLQGYNCEDMIQRIKSEYGTTMAKARFLARQETNLFMTDVRDGRYVNAGVKIAKWSTSNDIRVVGNPSGLYPKPSKGHGNHWVMNGKYCNLSDPTVYADTLEDARAGKWKSKAMIGAGNEHAGREYLCRCTYIPQL